MAGESLKPSPGDRAQGSTHYSAPWQQVLEVLQLPVNRVLPGDRLYLFELDRELECLPRLILQASTSEMPRESRIRLPVGALGLLEESARTPLVVSSEDPLPELESLVEFIVQEGCASATVISIQTQGDIWGCLVSASIRPCGLVPSETHFSLLASCLSAVIESANLRAETPFQLSGAMSLQTVGSALVEEQSLDAILSVIIDETIQLLDASDALVLLLQKDGNWFQVSARTGPALFASANPPCSPTPLHLPRPALGRDTRTLSDTHSLTKASHRQHPLAGSADRPLPLRSSCRQKRQPPGQATWPRPSTNHQSRRRLDHAALSVAVVAAPLHRLRHFTHYQRRYQVLAPLTVNVAGCTPP